MTSNAIDIVVVGAGVVGLSVACSLARGATVVLLESEDHPGYHASGRSAAIFAQNYGSAIVRSLTATSEPTFFSPCPEFSPAPLTSPRGLIRIATGNQLERLSKDFKEMSLTTDLRWLEPAEIEERVPLLRKGTIVAGFANDAAADIDVHALMSGYLKHAKKNGAEICLGTKLVSAKHNGKTWDLQTENGQSLSARVLLNAAGAWADELAKCCGARPVGLTPTRRSAVTFAAPKEYDVSKLPMIVDACELFYMKPEAGRLMASPCDETPVPPSDSYPEDLDIAVCLDRISRSFDIENPRPLSTWSGLRTFAPDRAPVCGWDPEMPGFYWLAGQGGYGVQTAPALAQIAADDILGHQGETRINIPGVDASVLSPARFT